MSAKCKQRRRKRKWEESKGTCFYCGIQMHFDKPNDDTRMTLDHLVPIIKGGRDNLENLVACCQKCNNKRGSMDIAEFVGVVVCKCEQPILKRQSKDNYRCVVCKLRYEFKRAA
jgi:5-methylcytosine-specific restriction endonuclease McrA